MKIKAAVVKEVGAPFEIKDDVELHDVGPTDLQIHMESVIRMKPFVAGMHPLAIRLFWVTKVQELSKRSEAKSKTSSRAIM